MHQRRDAQIARLEQFESTFEPGNAFSSRQSKQQNLSATNIERAKLGHRRDEETTAMVLHGSMMNDS